MILLVALTDILSDSEILAEYPRHFGRRGSFRCQCTSGCLTEVGRYQMTPNDITVVKSNFRKAKNEMEKYGLLAPISDSDSSEIDKIISEKTEIIAKLNQTLKNTVYVAPSCDPNEKR